MNNFCWKKLGKLFSPQDVQGRPWLKDYAQAPASLVLEDRVRFYFSCRPAADEHGQYVSYSAYVDVDRNNLFKVIAVSEKPVLSLGDLGDFDEFGIYPFSIIRQGENLLAYYGGWTRCESVPFNVAVGCAVSTNGGVDFKKIGTGPVLSYSLDEPFIISGPKIRYFNGLYHLFYIAGREWVVADGRPEPIYKIRMATSVDGINWTKLNRDIIQSRIGQDEAQASPDVIFANGKYHMFFCYRGGSNYRSGENSYRIGYAYSENLLDWVRDDSRSGIDVSTNGWDSEMISYPHVFELDGCTYMAYLGNQFGRFGFGLAVLEGRLI